MIRLRIISQFQHFAFVKYVKQCNLIHGKHEKAKSWYIIVETTRFFLYIRVETFLWWFGGWRRPESGDRMRERERRRREERGSLRSATVWTRTWWNGAVEVFEPLDLSLTDPTAVIGWICRWSDGPDDQSVYLVWRGTLKARYTGWRGATGSKLRLFQGLRCVWVLIWCGKPYCILLNQRFRSKHYYI